MALIEQQLELEDLMDGEAEALLTPGDHGVAEVDVDSSQHTKITPNTSLPPGHGAAFAKIYAWSTFAFTVAFMAGITLPLWLLDDDLAMGLGLATMTAVWGAPGFGIMLAGAIWAGKYIADE